CGGSICRPRGRISRSGPNAATQPVDAWARASRRRKRRCHEHHQYAAPSREHSRAHQFRLAPEMLDGGRLMSVAKTLIETAFPKLVHARRMRRLSAREKEIKLLPLLCSGARIAVDVGGNLGLYVHHFQKLCKSVVVFEPIPALQSYLRKQ